MATFKELEAVRNANKLPAKHQAVQNDALVIGFDYAPLYSYHFMEDMSGCKMVYEGGHDFTCTCPDGSQIVECAETYSELLSIANLLK